MTAYSIVLVVHSYVRWAVLALGALVVARAFAGWREGRDWERRDGRTYELFVGTLGFQFALGLLLYAALSPISRLIFSDARAMKDATLRFFGVEHVFAMVIVLGVVHVGRARARRAEGAARHKRVWISTLAALAIAFVSIPWSFFPYGRPLFRTSVSSPAPEASERRVAAACPPTYRSRCSACHGEHGRGDGPVAASLRPPPRDFTRLATTSDEHIAHVIREGGSATGLSPAMPAHRDLADDELAALVACVRGFRDARE